MCSGRSADQMSCGKAAVCEGIHSHSDICGDRSYGGGHQHSIWPLWLRGEGSSKEALVEQRGLLGKTGFSFFLKNKVKKKKILVMNVRKQLSANRF